PAELAPPDGDQPLRQDPGVGPATFEDLEQGRERQRDDLAWAESTRRRQPSWRLAKGGPAQDVGCFHALDGDPAIAVRDAQREAAPGDDVHVPRLTALLKQGVAVGQGASRCDSRQSADRGQAEAREKWQGAEGGGRAAV